MPITRHEIMHEIFTARPVGKLH